MTQSNTYLNISTPENVAFGYEVAGLGSRFMAAVIDSVALVTLQIVAFVALGFFMNVFDFLSEANTNWIVAAFTMLFFVLLWGFYILFELLWNGQTPGKRYFNLRVIRTDGSPIGFIESLIRNLVRIIDFIPAMYGFGVILMFFNNRARRLGDLAANTLVVHDRVVTLDNLAKAVKASEDVVVSAELTATLPIERLQESDIVIAEEYLLRRNDLTNAVHLVRPILTHLYTQMEVPLEEKMRYSEGVERIQTIVQARRALGG